VQNLKEIDDTGRADDLHDWDRGQPASYRGSEGELSGKREPKSNWISFHPACSRRRCFLRNSPKHG